LLLLAWIPIALHGNRYPAHTFFSQIIFLHNYYPGDGNYPLEYLWSVAVEEHFYFLLALILGVFLTKKSQLNIFPFICFGVVLSAPVYRAMSIIDKHAIPNHLTHLRLDALFMGALLSYVYHFYSAETVSFFRKHKWILTAASIALLLPAVFCGYSGLWLFSLGLSAEQLSFCLIVMLLLTNTKMSGSLGRIISAIGFSSYSIYLWHGPVEMLCYKLPIPPSLFLLQIVLYCSASIFAGTILQKVVEQRFLRLRDKMFPREANDNAEVSERLASVAV
jgi:peptidoglycan/LPS O-acetylase OafA/YrhL